MTPADDLALLLLERTCSMLLRRQKASQLLHIFVLNTFQNTVVSEISQVSIVCSLTMCVKIFHPEKCFR